YGQYSELYPSTRGEEADYVAAHVIKSGQYFLVPDSRKCPEWKKLCEKNKGQPFLQVLESIGSEIGLPLKNSAGQVIAVFNLHHPQKDGFSNETIHRLELIATQAAVAIDEALGAESARKTALERGERLAALLDVTRMLVSPEVAHEDLPKLIAQKAVQLVKADKVGVRLYDEARNELRYAYYLGKTARKISPKKLKRERWAIEGTIGGWVIKNQQPYYCPDTRKDPIYRGRRRHIIRSFINVPLSHGNWKIGVLSVDSKRVNAFSQDDQDLLVLLGERAGALFAHALERMQAHVYQAVPSISGAQNLQELSTTAVRTACEVLRAQGCSLFLTETPRKLVLYASTGLASGYDKDKTYEFGEGLTGWVAKHKAPLCIKNCGDKKELQSIAEDLVWLGKLRESVSAQGFGRPFLATPILINSEVRGVIRLSGKRNAKEFSWDDVELLKSFAAFLAMAINNLDLMENLRRERLTSAIGELAKGFAHEVRNPLNNIQAICTYLRSVNQDPETIMVTIKDIEEEIQRANSVAQSILDFSKGLRSPMMTTMNLYEALEEALQNAGPGLREKQIQVFRQWNNETPIFITGSPDQLIRAFRILIDNAVDAMEPGGELYLKGELDSIQQKICVEIRDTGCGMSPEVKQHIFDMFFTTKGAQGTGLGLWIVNGIISNHNGQISVESEKGKGTSVRLCLPIEKAITNQIEKIKISH
ncbi:MAG: GAF domain-containing protein, partial [candidate division KSB1 bacterium]|nr:GAF domain-containing protein [candidate division KSB1 bacterium]